MENLKEFKALIKRYESITIEEIEKVNEGDDMIYASKVLTGFGGYDTCTLCQPVAVDSYFPECYKCEWVAKTKSECMNLDNSKTYNAIENTKTSAELLTAFKERAEYMKIILKSEL